MHNISKIKERSSLRIILFHIIIFISLPIQGQISINDDTIQIGEVIIKRNEFNADRAGYKTTAIDSSILRNYSSNSLSDLLSENSKIFIRSYGTGGIATPSFRGTGASHTQIDWNGINLNSPMLGQSDLSLIPSGMIDDIRIYYGGASLEMNTGAIGGIINLETKPDWKKESLILFNPGFGSFGTYNGLIKVKSGNINFQTVTKAFIQSSENNFRYLNSVMSAEPYWETRRNNQQQQNGLIQEFYFRKSKNVVSARIWYQAAHRNLPASLLTQPVNTGEKQFDESLRTMLNFDTYKGKNSFSITGAWMLNRLNYSNRLASVDSRNSSQTIILKSGMESRINENTKLKVILNEELNLIKSNNYSKYASRNTTVLTALAENKRNGRISASLLLRGILDRNTFLIPDFSTGLQFRLFQGKEYFLKGNISRNSKMPSMNDMYWMPGGNPELKNEYAYIYELTYEMNRKTASPLNYKFDLSIFRNIIKDMIQWHPGKFSYWTADNIQNVNSMGLESSFVLDYSFNNLTSRFSAGYSFTKATSGDSKNTVDNSNGKQLMYIPQNQVNASISLNYKAFYISWLANLTGRRYITVDNSRSLPGYLLNNIFAGIKLNLKGNSLDINFDIDNAFNENYQSIAYFPLPGRSFFIKLLFQLVK